jgi:hypothetical protein
MKTIISFGLICVFAFSIFSENVDADCRAVFRARSEWLAATVESGDDLKKAVELQEGQLLYFVWFKNADYYVLFDLKRSASIFVLVQDD